MIEVSDEMLNKYIEGELDTATRLEINVMIKESAELRIRFNALMKVHAELKKIELKETRPDFTSLVMAKIIRPVKARKSDRAFIFSISGVFVIICLAIVGLAVYYSAAALGQSGQQQTITQTIFSFTNTFTNIIKHIFERGNISVIGMIMSFIIIISGYFFFENKKRFDAHRS